MRKEGRKIEYFLRLGQVYEVLNFSLDFLHIRNKTSQTLHPYLICISHFLLNFDKRQNQHPSDLANLYTFVRLCELEMILTRD